MPQVIPAVAAKIAAWWAGMSVAAKVWFVVKAVAFVATTAYARNQAKKAARSLAGALDSSRTQNIRSTAESFKFLVGECVVGGNVTFAHQTGSNNEYTHLIITHCANECDSFQAHYLNGEECTLDGDGYVLTPTKWAGLIQIKNHLGSDSQTVDTDLQTRCGSSVVPNTFRGRGICYTYLWMRTDTEAFASGAPTYTAKIRGALVYDPRDASTGWSANLALVLRWYMERERARGGVGATSDELPDAWWSAFANLCDEDVALNAGGTEKRYTANGIIDTATAPGENITALLDSGAAMMPYVNGQFVPRGGAHTSPVLELTDDDFVGPIQLVTHDSARTAINGCKGVYVAPENSWQPSDFPPHKNDTYMAEDGGERIWEDVVFHFVTSGATAQRLAKIRVERARQDFTFVAPCGLRALELMPGDVVSITRARYGFSAKQFMVQTWALKINPSDGGGSTVTIEPVFRETASGVWDWASGEETTVDLAPNSTLVEKSTVPTPSGFNAATATSSERTALPRVKVWWTAPASALVTAGGYTQIEYKKSADADWLSWGRVPGATTQDYVTDLEVGVAHDFRIKHINVYGHEGLYSATDTVTPSAGQGTYTALLTNEAHAVSCDAGGTPVAGELGSGGRAVTNTLAYAGASVLTAVASSPGLGEYAVSIATHAGTATFSKTDDDTVQCDAITTASAVCRVTFDLEGLLTVEKDFTVTKVTSGTDGNDGTNGDDAEVLYVLSDAAAVNKSQAGVYTPSTLNFSGWLKLGTAAPTAYAGRFVVETFDGSSWSTTYTSASDESTKAYSVPASVLAVRVKLYLAGGTSTLVDEQIVPIVFDGADGADGADGTDGTDGATVLGTAEGIDSITSTSYTATGASVTVTSPGTVHVIQVSGNVEGDPFSSSTTTLKVMRDGSTQLGQEVAVLLAANAFGYPAWIVYDSPSAGSHTYAVYAKTTSGDVTATDLTIIVQ